MDIPNNMNCDQSKLLILSTEMPGILDAAPVAMAICDDSFRVVYANTAFEQCLGLPREQLVEKDLYHKLSLANKSDSAEVLPKASGTYTLNFARADSSEFWGIISISSYAAETASPHYVVQITNIDAQKQEQAELAYQESMWRNAMNGARHGVWDYYAPNDSRYYSDDWKRIRGIPIDEEVCESLEDWEKRLHHEDLETVRENVRKHESGVRGIVSYEYRERRRDGKWIWILSRGRTVEWYDDGRPMRMTGTDVDITDIKDAEARKTRQAATEYQRHLEELERAQQKTQTAHETASAISRQDPLTELANRRVFSDELEQLTNSSRTGQGDVLSFAVLLVDLDRFKPINDIHGHQAGDQTICEIARRLENLLGDSAIVARLGGDEFGIIVKNKRCEGSILPKVQKIAEQVVDTISQPIFGDGFETDIGASIGIALYPEHGDCSQSLFRAADMAMYHVKQNGRGSWIVFHPEMETRLKNRALLEEDTRHAVRNEEIEPWFQPIIDLKTGQISGFEILARWQHPEHGFVSPDDFLPVIEQFGLMKEFTISMLRRACISRQNWPTDTTLALNVTAEEICDPAMPVRLMNVLSECDFLPTRLEIEVTESALLYDLDTAKQVISSLRGAGVRVSLDDFGTGYAGLNYLRELKLDCLKIDRSFIGTMTSDPISKKIVRSILALARELNLDTVAEGIEDGETHELVKLIGGSFGQGYYYGKAVPADQISELLELSRNVSAATG